METVEQFLARGGEIQTMSLAASGIVIPAATPRELHGDRVLHHKKVRVNNSMIASSRQTQVLILMNKGFGKQEIANYFGWQADQSVDSAVRELKRKEYLTDDRLFTDKARELIRMRNI